MNKQTLWSAMVLAPLIGLFSISVTHAQTARYVETDLVVNRQEAGVPALVDSNGIRHVASLFNANLVNPWGIAKTPTSSLWLSEGGAGVATLHDGSGAQRPLIVSIPSASNPLGTDGIPTGAAFNEATAEGAFTISGVDTHGSPVTAPAIFLFATKNGTIAGWNPNVNPAGFDPAKAGRYAITVVDNSHTGAYTGLAVATDANGVTRLYAANFGAGKVDVFDAGFAPVQSSNAFVDGSLPRGYAPFNVAAVTTGGVTRIFVMYAIQNLANIFGQGHGIVNTFGLDGKGAMRFAQHGQLNAPWGIVVPPAGFGDLAKTVWIGNFGDGHINAYHPQTGAFVSKVRGADGRAIVIDGLWTLTFGNGVGGGDADKLYFTAGPNGERDGLFGTLQPE